jgi:hypothetical protein
MLLTIYYILTQYLPYSIITYTFYTVPSPLPLYRNKEKNNGVLKRGCPVDNLFLTGAFKFFQHTSQALLLHIPHHRLIALNKAVM